MSGSYKTGRLYQKYDVQKMDGTPVDPDAQYFVLRIDKDPHARRALRKYALSVATENTDFGRDLIRWLNESGMTEAGQLELALLADEVEHLEVPHGPVATSQPLLNAPNGMTWAWWDVLPAHLFPNGTIGPHVAVCGNAPTDLDFMRTTRSFQIGGATGPQACRKCARKAGPHEAL